MDLRRIAFFALMAALAISLLSPARASAQANLSASQKAALQAELAQVEAEQKAAAKELADAQAQSASLSRDISILDKKIKAAELDIRAKNLLIKTLGDDINNKQNHINDLTERIDSGRQSLAQIMRKTNELDQYSVQQVLLSEKTLTGFFTDLDAFQAVENSLRITFEQLRTDQSETQAEKDVLDKRRNAEIDAKYAIQQQQKNIQSDQNAKQQLLNISKGNEKAYTNLIAQKQARAAEIRTALFKFAGGSNPIPFGTALAYAQAAYRKTGVDPAFILAILTQESNLGNNVGRCYLSNAQTGAGVYVTTGTVVGKVMNPTRDVPLFIDLTKELGMDPYQSVVSCQLDGIGWGGAMGPAQFIASTWNLIKDNVKSLLGITSTVNPWNPEHAIMAASYFMSNLGAGSNSYTAQLNAACRYFGGGTKCTSVTKRYGLNVMALKDSIQRNQIDLLQ